ncbi:MAG: bifunctional DNA-formamidopyrimidine glycosylase/DNA-(apurinic or apyrimidinic site) lyase [Acidobacteriia bacterium]|nr:bifunctional DNA-formamidopyrimidine glycosylase/DNA-(apurinic or apyrimidinic site) lyase [Terriglobia bacterium]
MPEMPEVEAVCRRLRGQLVGLRIRSARVLRCADKALEQAVIRRTVTAVDRRGKHILIRLSGGITVHVHLRMSGNLFMIPDHRLSGASARIIVALAGGTGLVLEDPRALARAEAVGTRLINGEMEKLGPEPLSPVFTPDWLLEKARGCRQPAKLFLMDQTKVAGLGNIYAAEALFQARINPRKPMQTLARMRVERLYSAIVGILKDAVQSAYLAYSGPGDFQEAESFPLAVYGRQGEPCHACGATIRRLMQGGRSTYYCPGCQK